MYYKILHGFTPMSVDDYLLLQAIPDLLEASDKFLLSKSDFCS